MLSPSLYYRQLNTYQNRTSLGFIIITISHKNAASQPNVFTKVLICCFLEHYHMYDESQMWSFC
jgi:hypothetical protein